MSVKTTEVLDLDLCSDSEQPDNFDGAISLSEALSIAEAEYTKQDEEPIFTKANFEHDLRKVSRKRNIPIGENIRDAIQSIKGK